MEQKSERAVNSLVNFLVGMESPRSVTVASMQALVDELQKEEKLHRVPISKTGQELLKYCQENEEFDYLVTHEGTNPYRGNRDKGCFLM